MENKCITPGCNAPAIYQYPFLCWECFKKKHAYNMHQITKKHERWMNAKRAAYCFLFCSLPLILIYCKFGFELEMIIFLSYLYGMFIPNIIEFLSEKF